MHYYTFFRTLFSWPNGIVVGNLLASVIWVITSAAGLWLYHRNFVKRIEAKISDQGEVMKDMFDPDTPGGITEVLKAIEEGKNNGNKGVKVGR